MTDVIEATLWSNDETFHCTVHVFWSEGTDDVTVTAKSPQQVILFQPNEPLHLHYRQGTQVHKEQVLFHEVKMLNRKPYYVFRLIRNPHTLISVEPVIALFSNEFEKGLISVVEITAHTLTLMHSKPIQGYYFDVTFKENNQVRKFRGKCMWSKQVDAQYYYQLWLI